MKASSSAPPPLKSQRPVLLVGSQPKTLLVGTRDALKEEAKQHLTPALKQFAKVLHKSFLP